MSGNAVCRTGQPPPALHGRQKHSAWKWQRARALCDLGVPLFTEGTWMMLWNMPVPVVVGLSAHTKALGFFSVL